MSIPDHAWNEGLGSSGNLPAQYDLKAASESESIDSGNHGFLTHSSTQPSKATKRVSHERRIHLQLSTPDVSQLDQILTSAEAFSAGSCDNGDAQIGLIVEPIEDLAHLGMPLIRDTIHLLLSVDGDKEYIVGRVGQEDMRRRGRSGLWFDGRHDVDTREVGVSV